ncbi:MAG TPA: hypothetical protein VN176_05510 [Verrucomicrobiae bacterium]|nr:hypothetical protein [Verrucomicrobiae bacterium]
MAPLFDKRKVLLIGADRSVQGLISTFLVTMGWTCTVLAAPETVSAALQREAFDAVLFGLGLSEAVTEAAIVRIKQIRPSLAGRIMVISDGLPSREVAELIERHDLVRVSQASQEGLLQQLWTALHELVVSPRSRELSPRSVQVARMIFDSFENPSPDGLRTLSSNARQLAYQFKEAVIDLSLDCAEGPNRISLAGQVLDLERKGKHEGVSVLLVGGKGTLARTTTNQFGEFQMTFESADDLNLEMRLAERSWVLVPLGKMDWVRQRASSSEAGV